MMLLPLVAMMQCLPSRAVGTHHKRSDIICKAHIICPAGQTSLKKRHGITVSFFLGAEGGISSSCTPTAEFNANALNNGGLRASSSQRQYKYLSLWICWQHMKILGGRPKDVDIKKTDTWVSVSLCRHYLSSREAALQVFSARMSLTTVFGMGTGGPSL